MRRYPSRYPAGPTVTDPTALDVAAQYLPLESAYDPAIGVAERAKEIRGDYSETFYHTNIVEDPECTVVMVRPATMKS